jgi:hypothetical protein
LSIQTSPSPTDSKKRWRQLERIIYPIALVTGVLGCVYAYWTTTPSYALASIVLSVQNHDVKAFEKYCDIDSVAGCAFDDLLNGPARSVVTGRMHGPMVFLGVDFLRFFKSDVVDIAHDQVVHFVADRNVKVDIGNGAFPNISAIKTAVDSASLSTGFAKLVSPKVCPAPVGSGDRTMTRTVATVNKSCPASGGAQRQSFSCPEPDTELVQAPHVINDKLKRQLREFGVSKNGFRGMKYFRIDGNLAVFGLEFYSPKLRDTWIAEFRMEDYGGYWRVTEISNLNQLVDKYIAVNELHQL